MRALSIAGLLLAGFPAHAAGWTQKQNGHYLKAWNRTLVGSAGYTADDQLVEVGGSYVDTSLNLYLEYGLTDAITLVAAGTPIGWAGFEGSDETYVGPLRIGARYGLPVGPVRFAVEGRYGYAPPVGDDAILAGTVGDTRYFYAPTLSTHSADLEIQVGLPLSFGWTSAAFGGRWHSLDELDPALFGSVDLGMTTAIGVVADIHFSFHAPLGDITTSNLSGAGETRYVGYGITVAYWLTERWSILTSLEGAAAFVANANTPSLILGVEHR